MLGQKQEIEDELQELREKRDGLKIKLAALPSAGKYTKKQITTQVQKLSSLEARSLKFEQQIIDLSNGRDAVSKRLEKIDTIKNQFLLIR